MRFIVPFWFSGDRDELLRLVPAERARVAELRQEGIIEQVYLAADGSGGWIVMAGGNESAVRAAFATLPIADLLDAEFIALRD